MGRTRGTRFRPLLLAVALINAWLLWCFYDRFWYPVDEGNYAHVAERLVAGDVLNVQVQDIHAGYINFLNAAAFRLFGLDLVSLRYPLMLVSLIQGCLVYVLLARRDAVLAFCGGIAITALGVLQFLNPTAHWYCLFLSVVLVGWMTWMPPKHPARLVGSGLLIGVITLFRQLSGVWISMAVLVVSLEEESTDAHGRQAFVARLLLLSMLAVLLLYLVHAHEPGGALLIGSWPIAILCVMLIDTRTSNRATARIVGRVAVGAAAAALPLVVYHLVHRSFDVWFDDTVVTALRLTQAPFLGQALFSVLPVVGLYQAFTSVLSLDVVKVVNGLYWAMLPLLATANGVTTVARFRRRGDAADLALPIVAMFYALVSLHFQIPIYLYYTVGLCLIGVLWLKGTAAPFPRLVCAVTTAALTLVAVGFHAGQPVVRTLRDILEGRRISTTPTKESGESGELPRCSLRLDPADRDAYRRLVTLIQAEVPADEAIFAVPSDAELYFLANRRNLFRFYNTALGIRNSAETARVIDVLMQHPPRVVTFRPNDKYNTEASREIMNRIRPMYDRIATVDGIEVYRLHAQPL